MDENWVTEPTDEQLTTEPTSVSANGMPITAEAGDSSETIRTPETPQLSDGSEFPSATAAPDAPKALGKARAPSESWMSIIQWLASTVAVAVFVITFVIQAFQIPSQSMENTLLIGDYLLVDKAHYGSPGIWGHVLPYSAIQRGDIIVFRFPLHPAQHFVKRVIGIPGDKILLFHGRVFVNGKLLDDGSYAVHKSGMYESYRDDFPHGRPTADVDGKWYLTMRQDLQNGQLVVPNDSYFVMGDNRDFSLDSRYWGFVPRENIIGRPLMIYLSLRQPGAWAIGPDDKLGHLLYSIGHLPEDARWDRTFRLVR